MSTLTPPDREKWIAEAAYYRAEKRGFMPGYALEDWLAAEALVDFEITHRAEVDPPGAACEASVPREASGQ